MNPSEFFLSLYGLLVIKNQLWFVLFPTWEVWTLYVPLTIVHILGAIFVGLILWRVCISANSSPLYDDGGRRWLLLATALQIFL